MHIDSKKLCTFTFLLIFFLQDELSTPFFFGSVSPQNYVFTVPFGPDVTYHRVLAERMNS
jgi:hypothetical protein